MLLTDARRAARSGPGGEAVPLAEQDRSRWDQRSIAEGVALVTDAMSRTALGPYQLQAAIAAVHAEAARAEDTDWPRILVLYGLLERLSDNPVVTLNHAVAAAMVQGPSAGLALLEPQDADPRMALHHRLDAVRAHLLEMAGDREAAIALYRAAARRTSSAPERRHLGARRPADRRCRNVMAVQDDGCSSRRRRCTAIAVIQAKTSAITTANRTLIPSRLGQQVRTMTATAVEAL